MNSPGFNCTNPLAAGRILLLLALGMVCACNRASSPPAEPTTGREVLGRMANAYHKAKTYADSGEARITYTADGRKTDETLNFSVTLERPNKLRLNQYACNMVSDGKLLQAAIEELPGQVVSVKAPELLSMAEVFRGGQQGVLYAVLTQQVAGGPVQLALLLEDEPQIPGLVGKEEVKLLEPARHPDGPCYRVQVDGGEEGKLVFWIDRNSYALRRIELPTRPLYDYLSKQAKITDLSLAIDFKGARLNEPIDPVAFQFVVPDGARLVSDFQVIPRPEPVSKLLGKSIPEFTFFGLDGKPVSRESLAGKVVVIDFWATWCDPCLQSLPELEKVYQKYKGNDRVAFVAVSIDQPKEGNARPSTANEQQPAASDDELAQAFKAIKVNVPIARDLKQFSTISFGVEQIPNMFILGPDGKLQDQELGFNPQLGTELPERIEKLLAGKDISDEARQRYELRLKEYEAQFQPPAGQSVVPGDLARATIAAPSSPTHLKLVSLWRYDELKDPGNILVVPGGDGNQRILIVDGWNRIAELNSAGKLVKLHEPELPKEATTGIIGFLRTAVDADGKRYFVAAADSTQRLHVFDDQFTRLWSYPDGTSAGGIADVRVGDLDGDGHPELSVSYYDVVGVQNVALDGKRRWANRAMANVYQLAVTGPDTAGHRQLLCASQRGTLTPIDSQGHDGTPLDVNHRFFRNVYSAQLTAEATGYCGITLTDKNEQILVGFNASGRELWSLGLPAGLQNHAALEPIASGNLLGARASQWILAGADGSIHIISAEGVEVDHFEHGQAISGLAVANFGDPILLIATAKGVEAFKVSEAAAANLSLKPER